MIGAIAQHDFASMSGITGIRRVKQATVYRKAN